MTRQASFALCGHTTQCPHRAVVFGQEKVNVKKRGCYPTGDLVVTLW